MERAIITISENGHVNIPSSNVWTVRNGVGGVVRGDSPDTPSCHKSNIQEWNTLLCKHPTECDLATPKSWATFYNLEVVIVLAFRLNTYEANKIRQKVLEALCHQKKNGINLLISLGHDAPMNRILS